MLILVIMRIRVETVTSNQRQCWATLQEDIYYRDEHLAMAIDDALKQYEKKLSEIGFDVDKGVGMIIHVLF